MRFWREGDWKEFRLHDDIVWFPIPLFDAILKYLLWFSCSWRCSCIEFILKKKIVYTCMYSLKLCKINSLTDRIFSRRDKKRGAIIIFLHSVCARICYSRRLALGFNQSPVRPEQQQKNILQFMLSSSMHIHYCMLVCWLPSSNAHAYTFLISHKHFAAAISTA